jgi:hypothetical protein
MGPTDRDILADRVCREVLRNPSYSSSRSRELVEWLKSDFQPTADIAGRALANLGPQAFDDLLDDVLARPDLPKPNVVWALELFPEKHGRLLPLLRDWLTRSTGDLRLQIAVSIAHVVTERLKRRLPVDQADVTMFKSVLIPTVNHGAVRVILRDFEHAAAEAG